MVLTSIHQFFPSWDIYVFLIGKAEREAERVGNEPNSTICSKIVIYENSFR